MSSYARTHKPAKSGVELAVDYIFATGGIVFWTWVYFWVADHLDHPLGSTIANFLGWACVAGLVFIHVVLAALIISIGVRKMQGRRARSI